MFVLTRSGASRSPETAALIPANTCASDLEGSLDLLSQHALILQGQNLLSSPARTAWAAPKRRATNGHAGNKLGSLDAVAIPSLLSDETQTGARHFRRSQLIKHPP